jgi:hypothetical protein
VVGTTGIGAGLSVPIAVETVACVVVGATIGDSASTEEGAGATACAGGTDGGRGEGEGSTALVCTWGGSTAVVDVAISVVVTAGGCCVVEVRIEVAAVRARERVHRRPLTVVIDSCGEAMQATGAMGETPARAQKSRRRERKLSAAGALSILTWKMQVLLYLLLYIRIAIEEFSWRWKRDRMVVNRWHEEVRLDRPETPRVPGAASSSVEQT